LGPAVQAPIEARALRLQPHQPHGWSGPGNFCRKCIFRRKRYLTQLIIQRGRIVQGAEVNQPGAESARYRGRISQEAKEPEG